jgi:hypothetical protein
MGGLQHVLVDIATVVISLFVPAVVWLLLVAGLFQLAVSKLRQIHITPLGLRRSTREGLG